MTPATSPTLIAALELAAKHKMTPDEIRAQRISMIVGLSGRPREQVADWLDRHEGRK